MHRHGRAFRNPNRWLPVALLALLVGASGCGPRVLEDPMSSFRDPAQGSVVHLQALSDLDASPTEPATLEALHRALWLPGYALDVREAALDRLIERDFDPLMRTLRQHLSRIIDMAWLERLCARIAAEGWDDLSPALVSSWARESRVDDLDRPEYKALATLFAAERVIDVVFEMFVTSTGVADQGLRIRCWTLLLRLDQRDRLVALVGEVQPTSDDAFLIDLRTGMTELGIVPRNREEILWLRQLCAPEHEHFRGLANQALEAAGGRHRAVHELRTLPILVSAHLHDAALLETDRATLYMQVDEALRGRKHYVQSSNFDNISNGSRQRLYEFRDTLEWGDLAAIRIALRALEVPQVVDHLFDFADRDHADTSTEYGGVMKLDDQGRFELLEFRPRVRQHDRRFNAPQAMFDAAYTALFHFHYHVQDFANVEFAGPGYGDINYADNTRANCLVFTFVNRDTMNVDFYRHGRVVVDLGVIKRAP